jgi:hypothetical protein
MLAFAACRHKLLTFASVDGTSKRTDPTCAAATLTGDEESMMLPSSVGTVQTRLVFGWKPQLTADDLPILVLRKHERQPTYGCSSLKSAM